jgi:hypothetical protein
LTPLNSFGAIFLGNIYQKKGQSNYYQKII